MADRAATSALYEGYAGVARALASGRRAEIADLRELTRRGLRARRPTDGYPEWKRAGLPIAAGEGG